MNVFHYRAYNLLIRSEVECPELLAADAAPGLVPDVVIHYGESPTFLPDSRARYDDCFIVPNECLLLLDDGSRIWVRHGREMVVTHPARRVGAEARRCLLDLCFSMLLHQRRALVLHGSAIETPRGVVTFVAPSGQGKSTLAMAFYDRGYCLVADDICAVVLDEHRRPLASPSYPRVKLWEEMVLHSGRETQHLRRVRPDEEKYGVPVRQRFARRATVLDTVYLLQVSETQPLTLQPCAGAERLAVLLNHTYRQNELRASGMAPHHFRLATEVAHRIRVCRVRRPATPFLLDALVTLLEQDFARGAREK